MCVHIKNKQTNTKTTETTETSQTLQKKELEKKLFCLII